MIINDIPVYGSFRVIKATDKTELFCSDHVRGDLPFDIAFLPVVAVYAANDEFIIETEV